MKILLTLSFVFVIIAGFGAYRKLHRAQAPRAMTSAPAHDAAPDLGFASFPVHCDAKGCELEVAYEPRKVCHLGDLDVIRNDPPVSKPLILSLEPLDEADGDFPRTAVPETTDCFATGFKLRFRLPVWSRPVQLGLFICRDLDKAGKCNGKTFAPVGSIVAQTLSDRSMGIQREPDWVYFFQPLFWATPDKMLYSGLTKMSELDDKLVARRANYMTSLFPAARAEQAKKVVFNAQELSRITRSMRLEPKESALTMVLPELDRTPGKCQLKPLPKF